MKCIKCSSSIPKQRLKALPDTKVCVECSSEKAVGAVDIVYHKTGNTIQIMDKDSADAINKSARRTGFGSLRAMRGGSGGETGKVELGARGVIPRVQTQEDFERVGEKMMELIDWKDRPDIIKFLEDKLHCRAISGTHYRKLVAILDQFKPEEKVTNVQQEDDPVSDEIHHVFRNWKNSKVYK
jgi:hypothetical protein